jgi:hypothetical protein
MPHSHLGCQAPKDYFIEQLLTIFVCGFIGVVAVLMYALHRGPDGMLGMILVPQFHLPVLIGGLAVLALVVVRAAVVWREAGELQASANDPQCGQNHVHTADCTHGPGLQGIPNGNAPDETMVDDHGHSHDMAWVLARMMILVFPCLLFAAGLPNKGFSADQFDAGPGLDPEALRKLVEDPSTMPEGEPIEKDGATIRQVRTATGLSIRVIERDGKKKYSVISGAGTEFRFNELAEVAADAEKRKSYQGQTAIVEGMFMKITDKEFTLIRLKMTCCGADAVQLRVRIVMPEAKHFDNGTWVRVTGVLQFLKPAGQDTYVPVLIVSDVKDVVETKPKSQFEQ